MGSTLVPPYAEPDPANPPQYARALEEANRVRLARAALKRRLGAQPDRASSIRLAAGIIADPPEVLRAMDVEELLLACRRIGPRAVARVLLAGKVHARRALSGLTGEERQRLIAALRMVS